MRHIATLLLSSLLLGCGQDDLPETRRQMLQQEMLQQATRTLAAAETPEERFYALTRAAKGSFVAGRVADAEKYAQELTALMPNYRGNWHYGNAVHDANLVLGRIAVQQGRIDDAKRFLLEAGKSPGSPQLNTFGPNMGLANDLLEKGEREVVAEYFELCRKFWELHAGRLDQWSRQVKDGKVPDFGANLDY